jgi:signal transduction histidine kinase/ligand-binding sensor domain-containing protein
LYESSDQVLWIGHETGHLTRLQSGQFHPVPLTDWPGGSVEAITSDETGDLWLLNNTGILVRLRDGHQTVVTGGASPTRKAVVVRGTNGINWLLAGGKVGFLEHGQVRSLELSSDGDDFYESVTPARDGALWVASSRSLRKWSKGGWVPLPDSTVRPPGTITALLDTSSGVLMAGTLRDGLYLLKSNGPAQHFDHATGISHNWIRGLCEDHEGNLWLGTGAGLDMLRRRKVQTLAAPDAWKGCGVLSFAVERDGSAWVGTEGAGLYRFERGLWNICNENCGLSNSFVWSVLPLNDNQLLVGTWGGGLFRGAGGRFEIPLELAQISSPVAALYRGNHGEIWIGTTAGIYRYESGRITWSAGPDKLVLPDVRAIAETPEGTLWFGMSGGGLASLKDGSLRQYVQQSSLGSDYVLCLLPDGSEGLWIGTSDRGLARFKRGKFSIIGPGQGLPTSVIYHLVDDQQGNLWMGSQAGILRVAKADLNFCADGLAESIPVLVYSQAEGLNARTCSGGFQPGACRAPDGRLWFPTPKGLAIIDPLNVQTNPAPPPVVIEEVLVDGQALPITAARLAAPPSVRISPGKQRIGFRYTALSFAVPGKVQFQHKLEGVEGQWVQAGTARTVEYNLLSPGTYTFRVIACNNDGVWNRKGATLAITLLPYFWQTWWFQIASLMSGAVVVGSGVLAGTRRHHRRKLEQLEKQRSLERERARIARDIHDDLGASLTRISLLSQSIRGEIEGRPEVDAEIDQIYLTARQLTRAMDEIVWAVNPKHDTLDSLVTYLGRFTQQFLSTAGIRCRLDVPMQLPTWPLTSEIRHNVYLALKETLNNVVQHAAATEVRVSLELNPGGFTLLVVDNGRGVDLQPVTGALTVENPHPAIGSLTSSPLRLSSGNGLLNIRKRLEEIGAHSEWHTAPGEGTRVKFVVPVPASSSQ